MKENKTKQAFTIVETLVTLLAITIMIAGPLTFMSRSYTYAEFITSRVISIGLAQEALELATAMRNIRIEDQGAEPGFKSIASSCSGSYQCRVDWTGDSSVPVFTQCTGDSCELTKTSDEPYSSSGLGDETGFYRYIKFTETNTPGRGYLAEAVVWNFVDGRRVEVKLVKLIYNLKIN